MHGSVDIVSLHFPLFSSLWCLQELVQDLFISILEAPGVNTYRKRYSIVCGEGYLREMSTLSDEIYYESRKFFFSLFLFNLL